MSPRIPLFVSMLALISTLALQAAPDLGFDPSEIDRTTGIKGTLSAAEGVYKISVPRKDVPVTVDGWKMPPFMGLTSWVAFESGGKSEAMAMGDLVVFEDEVNPVMSALFAHGIGVTALHNHFLFSNPPVFFMHVDGEGKVAELAAGVKAALAAEADVRKSHPRPGRTFADDRLPEQSSISAVPLESIFGAKGQQNSGMVKFVWGRGATMACGCRAGKEMGVNTWAAFAGADDNAFVDGDFAVHEEELEPVLKSLRANGVYIVAIHSHMIEETPRTLFFHYWGRGKAADLAQALKQALSLLKS